MAIGPDGYPLSSSSTADGKRERDRRHDAKRRVLKPWRAWYSTARWQALRLAQLTRQPLCERCEGKGVVAAATVAHHKQEHKGDPALFWDPANLASSCKRCHDSDEHSAEMRGYSTEIGPDGWASDPRHPSNRCGNG